MRVEQVAIERRGGLQQIILTARDGQVRLRDESEKALHGRIVSEIGGRYLVSRCAVRAGECGKSCRCRERSKYRAGAAEFSAALVQRRDSRERVYRIFGNVVLVVDEEIGFVAAVVDVRDFQRAADGAADAFVVRADLLERSAGDREGLGIEGGVGVAVEEREADAVHVLAEEPADLRAVRPAAAAGTARESAASADGEYSALAKAARGDVTAAGSAEGIARARSLRLLPEAALALVDDDAGKISKSAGRETLPDGSLQQERVG